MRATRQDVSHFEQGFKFAIKQGDRTVAYADDLGEALDEAVPQGAIVYRYEVLGPSCAGQPRRYQLHPAVDVAALQPEQSVPAPLPLPPRRPRAPRKPFVVPQPVSQSASPPAPSLIPGAQTHPVDAFDPRSLILKSISREVGVHKGDEMTAWHAARVAQFLRAAWGVDRVVARDVFVDVVGSAWQGTFDSYWPKPFESVFVPWVADSAPGSASSTPVPASTSSEQIEQPRKSVVKPPRSALESWGARRGKLRVVTNILLYDVAAALADIRESLDGIEDYETTCKKAVELGVITRERAEDFLKRLNELPEPKTACDVQEDTTSDIVVQVQPRDIVVDLAEDVLPIIVPDIISDADQQIFAPENPVQLPELTSESSVSEPVDTQEFAVTSSNAVALVAERLQDEVVFGREPQARGSDGTNEALYVIDRIKGGDYRADEFHVRGLGLYSGRNPLVQELVRKGLVRVSRAGAVSATKEGRDHVASLLLLEHRSRHAGG